MSSVDKNGPIKNAPLLFTALQYIIVSANIAVQSRSSRLDFRLGKTTSRKKRLPIMAGPLNVSWSIDSIQIPAINFAPLKNNVS